MKTLALIAFSAALILSGCGQTSVRLPKANAAATPIMTQSVSDQLFIRSATHGTAGVWDTFSVLGREGGQPFALHVMVGRPYTRLAGEFQATLNGVGLLNGQRATVAKTLRNAYLARPVKSAFVDAAAQALSLL